MHLDLIGFSHCDLVDDLQCIANTKDWTIPETYRLVVAELRSQGMSSIRSKQRGDLKKRENIEKKNEMQVKDKTIISPNYPRQLTWTIKLLIHPSKGTRWSNLEAVEFAFLDTLTINFYGTQTTFCSENISFLYPEN